MKKTAIEMRTLVLIACIVVITTKGSTVAEQELCDPPTEYKGQLDALIRSMSRLRFELRSTPTVDERCNMLTKAVADDVRNNDYAALDLKVDLAAPHELLNRVSSIMERRAICLKQSATRSNGLQTLVEFINECIQPDGLRVENQLLGKDESSNSGIIATPLNTRSEAELVIELEKQKEQLRSKDEQIAQLTAEVASLVSTLNGKSGTNNANVSELKNCNDQLKSAKATNIVNERRLATQQSDFDAKLKRELGQCSKLNHELERCQYRLAELQVGSQVMYGNMRW